MKSKEQLYDELLILKASQGDEQAFTTLVKNWSPKLFYYLRRLLNQQQDVDDVMQNTWIALYRSLKNIRDISQYRVYLFSIARSKAIDHLRKEKRYRFYEMTNSIAENTIAPKNNNDNEIEKIHWGLEKVDFPSRDILILYYLNDLSVAEISHIMKIPKGTVKSRLYTARKELRDKIT